jgi:hypothetical protein
MNGTQWDEHYISYPKTCCLHGKVIINHWLFKRLPQFTPWERHNPLTVFTGAPPFLCVFHGLVACLVPVQRLVKPSLIDKPPIWGWFTKFIPAIKMVILEMVHSWGLLGFTPWNEIPMVGSSWSNPMKITMKSRFLSYWISASELRFSDRCFYRTVRRKLCFQLREHPQNLVSQLGPQSVKIRGSG